MPYTMLSPSPLPLSGFVEKNGSNARSRTCGLMPRPVSVDLAADAPRRPRAVRRVTPPLGRHRVERVEHEIGQRLAQLGGIGLHRQRGIALGADLVADTAARGVALPARAGHLEHVADRRGQADRAERSARRPPRELLDAPHGASAVARGLGDELDRPAIGVGRGSRLGPEEQLGPAQDHREQVVEVVGDPRRHLAEGPQALRLQRAQPALVQLLIELRGAHEGAELSPHGLGERELRGLDGMPGGPPHEVERARDLALDGQGHDQARLVREAVGRPEGVLGVLGNSVAHTSRPCSISGASARDGSGNGVVASSRSSGLGTWYAAVGRSSARSRSIR